MTFTDDDLKQIKQRGAHKAHPWSKRLIALVARLEAAERLIFADGDRHYDELVDEWRKAAGK